MSTLLRGESVGVGKVLVISMPCMVSWRSSLRRAGLMSVGGGPTLLGVVRIGTVGDKGVVWDFTKKKKKICRASVTQSVIEALQIHLGVCSWQVDSSQSLA